MRPRNGFAQHPIRWESGEVRLAGTGYTGERGGEVCTDPQTGHRLAERLVSLSVVPCGLASRDTLRLEAGLPLWGSDIDESTTPLEAGLDFAVVMDHDFRGRAALESQMQEGPSRRLVGFVLDEKGIPRHGYKRADPGRRRRGHVRQSEPGARNWHWARLRLPASGPGRQRDRGGDPGALGAGAHRETAISQGESMTVRIEGRPEVPDGYGVKEEGPFLNGRASRTGWSKPPSTGWPPLALIAGHTSSPVGGSGSTSGSGTTDRQ